MRKNDLANELLALEIQRKAIEEKEDAIKKQLLNYLMDGEKLEEKLGSVLKVAPSPVLNVPPENARGLFEREEDFMRYVKVNVGDLKKAFGENTVVPLGYYEERAASLRISLKK